MWLWVLNFVFIILVSFAVHAECDGDFAALTQVPWKDFVIEMRSLPELDRRARLPESIERIQYRLNDRQLWGGEAVAYEVEVIGGQKLIRIREGEATDLNRRAKRYLEVFGVSLVFDPQVIFMEESGGRASKGDRRLYAGFGLLDGSGIQLMSLIHEEEHLRRFKIEDSGDYSRSGRVVVGRNSSALPKLYEKGFSLDEIYAYRAGIKWAIEETLRRARANPESFAMDLPRLISALRQQAETSKRISQFILEMTLERPERVEPIEAWGGFLQGYVVHIGADTLFLGNLNFQESAQDILRRWQQRARLSVASNDALLNFVNRAPHLSLVEQYGELEALARVFESEIP